MLWNSFSPPSGACSATRIFPDQYCRAGTCNACNTPESYLRVGEFSNRFDATLSRMCARIFAHVARMMQTRQTCGFSGPLAEVAEIIGGGDPYTDFPATHRPPGANMASATTGRRPCLQVITSSSPASVRRHGPG